MSRLTFAAFIMLTGFFYVTGKPVEKVDLQINSFADTSNQKFASYQTAGTLLTPAFRASERQVVTPSQSPPLMVRNAQGVALPTLPSRNPRRGHFVATKTPPLLTNPLAHRKSIKKTNVKVAALKKPVKNLTFEDVRSKSTSGAAKPLAVSYQQRFVRTKKPVLGPRLTAILLKRELRRVGCYDGTITSNWDDGAKNAVKNFNLNSSAKLAVRIPTATSLELVQQASKVVCRTKPSIARTIVASAPAAILKVQGNKKASQWKSGLKQPRRRIRKAAYAATTPARSVPKRDVQTKKSFRNNKQVAPRRAKRIRAKKRKYRAIAKRTRRARRYARKTVRRRTAVRSWRRTYRRKRFGFRRTGLEFSIGN